MSSLQVFGFVLPVFLVCSCATAMYDGPRRSRDQVAIIKAEKNASVYAIDGRNAAGGFSFAALPGIHNLAVDVLGSLHAEEGEGDGEVPRKPLAVCFRARAGHIYRVSVNDWGQNLRVKLVDDTDEWDVPARKVESPFVGCEPSTLEAQPQAESGGIDPFDAKEKRASEPYEDPNSVSPPPTPRPGSLADRITHAGTGVRAELGIAFGNGYLLTPDNSDQKEPVLAPGEGSWVTVGGEWTPLRSSGGHGVGLSMDVGFKYASASTSQGDIGFLRFPVLVAAHGLIHVSGSFFLIPRLGVEKDLNPNVFGSRVSTYSYQDISSRMGWFGEGDGHWQFSRRAGFSVGLRFTQIRYERAHVSVDASSITILATFHFPL
jgi:hypothetical protein